MAVLNVRKASNLILRGQGPDTVLVMGDPALGGLLIDGGDTVMVRDFAVDYNMLGYTQGTVVDLDADAGAFVLRLHDGYPTPARISDAVPGHHAGYRIYQAGGGAAFVMFAGAWGLSLTEDDWLRAMYGEEIVLLDRSPGGACRPGPQHREGGLFTRGPDGHARARYISSVVAGQFRLEDSGWGADLVAYANPNALIQAPSALLQAFTQRR